MSEPVEDAVTKAIGTLFLIAFLVWIWFYDGCTTIKSWQVGSKARKECKAGEKKCQDDCSEAFFKRPNAKESCLEECDRFYKQCIEKR